LEIGFGPGRRQAPWVLLGGLALGGALLAKGPAGLPVVLGALVGAPLATRSFRGLRRPGTWLLILLGALCFTAWAWAVFHTLRQGPGETDLSGLQEVASRMSPVERIRELPEVLSLPLVLLVYAFPFSASALLLWRRDLREHLPPEARLRTLALLGVFWGALVVGVLAMMANPRYGYMALPFLGLLGGALYEAHRQHPLPRPLRLTCGWLIGLFAAATGILHLVFPAVGWTAFRMHPVVPSLAAAAGVLLSLPVFYALTRGRGALLTGALALQVLLLSVGFTVLKNAERLGESGALTGAALAARLPPGTPVHAERMVYFHPEVFHYGQVAVRRYAQGWPTDLEADAPFWFLLHPREWDAWGLPRSNRLDRVERLPGPDRPWFGRYTPRPD